MEQLSDEWFKERIGSIGGSSIGSVCAKGSGKTRDTLLYRFAGEILSGEKYHGFTNEHMDRGIEQESEARAAYGIATGNKVQQVGLIRLAPYKHYSPDGLVGENGIIEIKCVTPAIHVKTIMMNRLPPEYMKQIQWGLHVCKRDWCDFISYSPTVTSNQIWINNVTRDDKLITEMDKEADKFIGEMLLIVKKIKGE